MASSDFWMIWPGNPMLSALILFFIAVIFLYGARVPMHAMLRSLGHAIGGPARLAARSLFGIASELRERNKSVLLAHGRQEVGKRIEREFERIGAIVARDLQGYPAMQRKLTDEITRIEEDYKKCGEVPPPPPEWVEAVSAVANVKTGGSELVQKILEDIKGSITKMHDKTVTQYRSAYESRHKILESFLPFWRNVDKTMTEVDKKIDGLKETVGTVDAHMEKYEQIAAKSPKAEQALTHSDFTQFIIATIVMIIAVGGAFINFKLIALPMSEMVGAGDYITASLRTSEVAALVIILVETSMGLFMMEALRITHLFPLISNLDERMRKRMFWIALTLLLILAGIESALALMRDMLIADKQALVQSLAVTAQAAAADASWVTHIPTAGQMLLGFILPFALAFVAIPLETFINTARTVLGAILVLVIRGIALLLRVVGNLAKHASRVLITLYDVIIVVPLLIEKAVRGVRDGVDPVPGKGRAAGRGA